LTKDGNNLWIAEEGVYLPVRGSDVESDGEKAEL
jgi:hypothetical protein